MTDTDELAGKVALVTGGASGIGLACAQLFAAKGAAVVIADLDEEAGATELAALQDAGAQARFVRTDVTDPDQVRAMVAVAVDEFGQLDMAVNNAGTPGVYAELPSQKLADWEHTLSINLTSVFLSLQSEIPALLDAGGGGIVNMASAAGLIGFAHLPAYVASKHGVVGLTKAVALEYARANIRVNAVCPGTVRTPMLAGFAGSVDALEGMGRIQPIGRLAEPDEIAAAAVWLCSPSASFVTGHAMSVDGGVVAT